MTHESKVTSGQTPPAKPPAPRTGRAPAAEGIVGGSYVNGEIVAATKPPKPIDGATVRAAKRKQAREGNR
jgi:hypothetical protein